MAANRSEEIAHTGYSPRDVVLATPQLLSQDVARIANPTAAALLRRVQLNSPVSLAELATLLVDEHDISRGQALHDVAFFAADAQGAGLFSYRSTWARNVRYGWLRPLENVALSPWVKSGSAMSLRRRGHHRPTLANTVRFAGLRQGLLGLVLGAIMASVVLALYWLLALDAPDMLRLVLAIVLLTGLVAATSGAAHEVAHLLVARALRCQVHSVYADRMIVGVHRHRVSRSGEAAISAVGPLLGAMVAAVWFALTWRYVNDTALTALPAELVLVSLLIPGGFFIIFHVAALFPPSADGRALQDVLKPRTQKKSDHATP